MKDYFRNMDIYLIDQILKGRFDDYERVVDLGCGGGRNLLYFLRNDFQVFGLDQKVNAINNVLSFAQKWQQNIDLAQFKTGSIEANDFPPGTFDLVICNAVLHFANDVNHFEQMLFAACKLLCPGGFFFARLASDIGIENQIISRGNRRYTLPDGSDRFLVNQTMLLDYTRQLNGQLSDPIKTTNVQNLRCMTTWCMTVK